MSYASWSVVFGEQPSAAKWNILGTNDAAFNDGTGLNSGAIQQQVSTLFSAVATGSTVIPFDDTIPQSTEGDQYMTQAITPKNSLNTLVIEANVCFANSVINDMMMALFQDATANALAITTTFCGSTGKMVTVNLRHTMLAGTTSATTFKIRLGGDAAGTTTFNGFGGARQFGAIPKSNIMVTEYKA